jgi:hypothetical protein
MRRTGRIYTMALIRTTPWQLTSSLSAKKPKRLPSRAAAQKGSTADVEMISKARLRVKQNGKPGGRRRGSRNDSEKGSAQVRNHLTTLDVDKTGRQAAHPKTMVMLRSHAGAEVQALATRTPAGAPMTTAGGNDMEGLQITILWRLSCANSHGLRVPACHLPLSLQTAASLSPVWYQVSSARSVV